MKQCTKKNKIMIFTFNSRCHITAKIVVGSVRHPDQQCSNKTHIPGACMLTQVTI